MKRDPAAVEAILDDAPPPDDRDAPGGDGLSALTTLSAQAPAQPPPWPTLDDAALHGLPGHVVSTLEPHTEADPVALLLSYLLGFGSAVGPGPHAVADAAQHPARLYVVPVGETSRARKGTSWANVRRVFDAADPDWTGERIIGGLASGEGLIAAVADHDPDDDDEPAQHVDKRLLVVEEEYARVLAVAARQGNTLSAVVRQAWDTGNLDVTTRRDPLRARGAHVSILAHITVEELRRCLLATEQANGFANRFLFALVRRRKLLPSGGNLPDDQLADLGRLTSAALTDARKVALIRRDRAAEERWAELYARMAEEAPAGLVGAVTARAEAQTLRLSVAYALTDASRVVRTEHLEAAWELWRYCEQSAAYIFGDSLGDDVADQLYQALLAAGAEGLDGTGQRDLFGRHVAGARLDAARQLLEDRGLAVSRTEPTGGRPRTVTVATKALKATEGGQQ